MITNLGRDNPNTKIAERQEVSVKPAQGITIENESIVTTNTRTEIRLFGPVFDLFLCFTPSRT